MGFKKIGNVDYEKREAVKARELVGKKFLIERVGNAGRGEYGPFIPVDVTIEDGTQRVLFVGSKVLMEQLKEEDVVGTTATIRELQTKDGKRTYFVFEEVEV